MNTYTTSQVASIIGIHPNTVRRYEEWGLITTPKRQSNHYRIYTDLQLDQFRLARKALQVELLQNGLRKKIMDLVKVAAKCEFKAALVLCQDYINMLNSEIINAQEASSFAQSQLSSDIENMSTYYKRKEIAALANITIDTLRNWEMNGLLTIKRSQNGYRAYTLDDLKKIKIIRSLRCANYSLSAILRMLYEYEHHMAVDIVASLNTPSPDEDIISACDQLITSLKLAEQNALLIQQMLLDMDQKYSNPPL